MPDKNKLQVMQDRNIKIVATCGTCKHSQFQRGSSWGYCTIETYEHQKHAGLRHPPAHLSFVCNKYEFKSGSQELGAYEKLITRES